MNMKFLKRVLAVTLAASLMVAPALTAGATTNSSEPSSSTGDGTPAPTVTYETTGKVSAGGTVVTSDVPGVYSVRILGGVALRKSAKEIKADANLAANESVFVKAYDITPAKAPKAFASANEVIAAMGGTLKGALNLDLGKLTDGKNFTTLNGVAVPATFGVKNVTPGKKLVVVHVIPGGEVEVLADLDNNPNTVTVNVTGFGAYFVVEVDA